jgi:hypothetical protein
LALDGKGLNQTIFSKQKMRKKPTVWYQLVKENGDKLGCTSVAIPKKSNIDQFRKLVKLENAKKLSH